MSVTLDTEAGRAAHEPGAERSEYGSQSETCPVCATAELIAGKWTILVIRDLAGGSCRFCELERSLRGISPRTLSLRLRALEEHGIVERRTHPESAPRVDYALTPKGLALIPVIEDMRRFGRDWLGTDAAGRTGGAHAA